MARGHTLLELLIAMILLATIAGFAVALLPESLDRSRTSAAAAYVGSRIALARMEAVRRSAFVALQFTRRRDGYWFRTYIDGNRNGVFAAEILAGVDPPLKPDERLDYHFPGITFGILPGVTGLDPGEPFDAGDPIQIGRSTLLSFNPNGSATGGTLFVRGRHVQFAVRVLGVTARQRTFEFNFQRRTWRLQ
jgi:prepilin-type N-terminal cleavage/methylation domain-containing protein